MQKLWVIILVFDRHFITEIQNEASVNAVENSPPVMSKCLSLYVCLSSSEFIFYLIFYCLTTFSFSGLAVSKVASFYGAFLIYLYIYLKWWLPDSSHVCFLWLIALLHHWSAVIGWFVDWEVVCIHSSALILFLSISDSCCRPLASPILCTYPPTCLFIMDCSGKASIHMFVCGMVLLVQDSWTTSLCPIGHWVYKGER
jgi:hypothetical protein